MESYEKTKAYLLSRKITVDTFLTATIDFPECVVDSVLKKISNQKNLSKVLVFLAIKDSISSVLGFQLVKSDIDCDVILELIA
ncbi:hypothetical protein [Photobacterium damselae]|uniref:hypothetical protein n=1 Tax=Photobacterium damselae TaxID=38293 RepID=UPI001F47B167|nr:hypothetical protein [Photobacterium damselae]UKA04927.1 hypothetical protein IHC89_22035 [Photobacterium damselae subsp. damselae]